MEKATRRRYTLEYKQEAVRLGMPGSFCTRVNETNWYERSHLWREARNTQQSRS
jgi:hypothetical protein